MKHSTTRRQFVSAVVVASIAATSGITLASQVGEPSMQSDPMIDLLKASMSNKRGLNVVLDSGPLALVVTEVTDTHAIGRSQQYDRIVVRIDQIQAAYQ